MRLYLYIRELKYDGWTTFIDIRDDISSLFTYAKKMSARERERGNSPTSRDSYLDCICIQQYGEIRSKPI